MVRGIEKFREKFSHYTGQYVFIGGAACEIILGRQGIDFRATKDLDIVLIVEALDKIFLEEFENFIHQGGYEHIDKGTGENQFFRFTNPTDTDFPVMIELFSRRPDYLMSLETRLTPVYVSEDSLSLSAILLDDAYYELLKHGSVEVEGVSVLDLEYLILFKMKAWLDLSSRKERGEQIDSKNIKKHRNDILRLAANIDPASRIELDDIVLKDVMEFFLQNDGERIDVKTLGILGDYSALIERLRICYQIQ